MKNNAVVYYSNTGESYKIACYIANKLNFKLYDIFSITKFDFGDLVIVFPVHCQNIPTCILPIFNKINAVNVAVIATYGKMSYGRVIYDCQKKFSWKIIAGAYVPTKHSYLENDTSFTEFEKLDFVSNAFINPTEKEIRKTFKNPFAGFIKGIRTRAGVRLIKNENCNDCGLCEKRCDNKKCVRCLKCLKLCPKNAISFKLGFFTKLYLNKRKNNQIVIFK